MRSSAVVSSKGQIVIPAEFRKKYRLEEGTRVTFREENDHLVLEPGNVEAILALYGSLKGLGLGKLLQTEREQERQREEQKLQAFEIRR